MIFFLFMLFCIACLFVPIGAAGMLVIKILGGIFLLLILLGILAFFTDNV